MPKKYIEPKFELLGRYTIFNILGESDVCIVYKAYDKVDEIYIAIKEYFPNDYSNRDNNFCVEPLCEAGETKEFKIGLQAFTNKAKGLRKLSHPNIIQVINYFEANGTAYIIMPFIEHITLSTHLTENGKLSPEQILIILEPLIGAIDYLHKNAIVHSDISPANILIDTNDNPILINFGAASFFSGNKTTCLMPIIREAYSPIELYNEDNKKITVGPYTDIYSLSATIRHCVTGIFPPSSTERKVEDTVKPISGQYPLYSSKILALVDEGLKLSPEDRSQSVDEWLIFLMSLEDEEIVKTAAPNEDEIKEVKATKETKNTDDTVVPLTAKLSGFIRKNIIQIAIITIVIALPLIFAVISHNQKQESFEQELLAWESARTQNTLEGYQAFLKIYKDGENSKKAESNITSINEKIKTAEAAAVAKVILITSIQKVLLKLRYPVISNGILDARTVEAIKIFKENQQQDFSNGVSELLLEDLQNAYILQENIAWQEATKLNNKLSYTQYIDKYSDGKFYLLAIDALKLLEEEEIALKTQLKNSELVQIKENNSQIEQLKNIQKELNRLGFNVGHPDGIIGLKTKTAITEFQKRINVKSNGKPTQLLLIKLQEAKPLKYEDYVEDVVGVTFKMRAIPAGNFTMGSNSQQNFERPKHKVSINTFFLMETEVTYELWGACIAEGGCTHNPKSISSDESYYPVIDVSWNDINQQFIPWLNKKTGRKYRLPSEAEWEYAARANSETLYHWGNDYGKNNANCAKCGTEWDGKRPAPIKSFKPNEFGLYDMHGNVWEWVQDCWSPNYNSAPTNGTIKEQSFCNRAVLRGGSWLNQPIDLRVTNREYDAHSVRYARIKKSGFFKDKLETYYIYGFRLAR